MLSNFVLSNIQISSSNLKQELNFSIDRKYILASVGARFEY